MNRCFIFSCFLDNVRSHVTLYLFLLYLCSFLYSALQVQDSHKQSTEETVAHSTEHQPSLEMPQISLKATDPGEHQVRNCGTHNLPFKAVPPRMQLHTRQTLKQTSEERTLVKGNLAVTPLKDLFKTLDPTVSHFRH